MTPDGLIGETLAGIYLVEDHLGSGGMGTVYRARRVDIGHPVVIKVLREELSTDYEQLERFKREAKAAAALCHPNVAQVTDFHVEPGQLAFMVVELIEGLSLEELLRREGQLTPVRAAALIRQVLGALEAAHRAGVVHRDVKPANIMVVDVAGAGEIVKLLDFGIAKMLDGAAATKLTATGIVLGTPKYMAPEQIAGGTIDHRIDLYAAGAILYEALSGRLPFEAENVRDYLVKVTTEDPCSLGEVAPELPPKFIEVVDRSIAPSPDERFQTAEEMCEGLESWSTPGASTSSSSLQSASPTTQSSEEAEKKKLPRSVLLAGAVLVLVLVSLLGTLVGYVLSTWTNEGDAAPPEPTPVVMAKEPAAIPAPLPVPQPLPKVVNTPPLGAHESPYTRPAPPSPVKFIAKTKTKETIPLVLDARSQTLRGVYLEVTKGTAVTVTGRNALHIKQCVLKGETGIDVRGRAHVTVEESWIEGTKIGAHLSGKTRLVLIRSTLVGPRDRFSDKSVGAAILLGPTLLDIRNGLVWGSVRRRSNESTVRGLKQYLRP